MLNIKDLKIGTRLGAGFSLILFVFIGAVIISLLSLNLIDSETKTMKNETLPSLLLAHELDLGKTEVAEILTDVALTHNEAGFKEAEQVYTTFRENATKLKEIYKSQNDISGLALVEDVEKSFDAFYKDGVSMASVYIAKGQEAGNKMMEGFDRTHDKIFEAVEQLRKKELNEANSAAQMNIVRVGRIMKGLIFIGLAAIVIGMLISFFITRSINRPIEEAIQV